MLLFKLVSPSLYYVAAYLDPSREPKFHPARPTTPLMPAKPLWLHTVPFDIFATFLSTVTSKIWWGHHYCYCLHPSSCKKCCAGQAKNGLLGQAARNLS